MHIIYQTIHPPLLWSKGERPLQISKHQPLESSQINIKKLKKKFKYTTFFKKGACVVPHLILECVNSTEKVSDTNFKLEKISFNFRIESWRRMPYLKIKASISCEILWWMPEAKEMITFTYSSVFLFQPLYVEVPNMKLLVLRLIHPRNSHAHARHSSKCGASTSHHHTWSVSINIYASISFYL